MPAAASNAKLVAAGRRRASRTHFPKLSKSARQRLRKKAIDLAEASFAEAVTPCELIRIEASLLQIDARLEARP